MRLSNRAQNAVAVLTDQLSGSVRKVAAQMATNAGREFADEKDVKEAFRLQILAITKEFGATVDLRST